MTDEEKLVQLGDPSGRQTADYWNQWFEIVCKQEHRPFEWYCDVKQVVRILDYHIGRQSSREEAEPRMIHPGSGNSLVPVQLRDEFGFPHKQVVVDISDVALDEMQKVHDKSVRSEHPSRNLLEIEYVLGDVLQPPLKYDSNTFDAWIDKGLVDALFKDDKPTSSERCRNLFQEANRLLRCENGAMIIITLAEDHSLRLILDNWNNQSWQPCVHVWDLTPISGEMRPFGFVLLKSKLESPPYPSLCRSVVWHAEDGATESIPARDNAFEAVKVRSATSREEFRSQIARELGSVLGADVPLMLATLEIKPSDADVDLIALGQKIADIPWRSTVSDNFTNSRQLKPHWQPERKVVPIGYGIEKLLLQCIINSEDLEELLQAMRAWSSNAAEIQSIDIDWENTLRVKSSTGMPL